MSGEKIAYGLAIVGAILFAVMVVFAGSSGSALFGLRGVLLGLVVGSEIVALILGLMHRGTRQGRMAIIYAVLVLAASAALGLFATGLDVGGTLPS